MTIMEEAIKKIKEEMEKEKNNLFISEVGKYLLVQIETNKEASEKIVAKEKSIAGALNCLESEAKKRAKRGDTCVIISDAEGFNIINKYFEFENIQFNLMEISKNDEEIIEAKNTEKNNVVQVDFDINLDDLL